MKAPFADLRSELRAKAVPPEPDGLMADIDASFKQDVLNLAQRKRIANVHHHRVADHIGRTIEAAERVFHPRRVWNATHRLKSDCSDSARLRLRNYLSQADA